MTEKGIAKVVILGTGAVGRALARQIVSRAHGKVHILALTDSKGAFAHRDFQHGHPLDAAKVLEACTYKQSSSPSGERRSFGRDASSVTGVMPGATSLELVKRLRRHPEDEFGVPIIVDATATIDTVPALRLAVAKGFRVCSANKKPFADAGQSVFDELTQWQGSCRFESSAGACTPFVATCARLANARDKVDRWMGTMSGTLGYISTGLRDGLAFSKVLKAAIEGGYTEPDCRDDLSGFDVARKAVILHRVLGGKVELSELSIEPLFPEALRSVSYAEFVERVCDKGELDEEIGDKASKAKSNGCVLQYVASKAEGGVEVGLKPVPIESPLGQLKGTANMLELHSEYFREAPLVVQGCGAGGDPTASGMLADIIELAHTSPPP